MNELCLDCSQRAQSQTNALYALSLTGMVDRISELRNAALKIIGLCFFVQSDIPLMPIACLLYRMIYKVWIRYAALYVINVYLIFCCCNTYSLSASLSCLAYLVI